MSRTFPYRLLVVLGLTWLHAAAAVATPNARTPLRRTQALEPAGSHVLESHATPHPYAARTDGGVAHELRLHWPGASYVAVRFDSFDLADGDSVTVSDPEGRLVHRYEGGGRFGGGRFWSKHVNGDTAIVRLHGASGRSAHGYSIDRWSRGFSRGELLGGPERGLLALDPLELTPPDLDPPRTKSICNEDDRREAKCFAPGGPVEDVEIYEHSKAVGRVLIHRDEDPFNGDSWGSGFLLGSEGHFLMSLHVGAGWDYIANADFEFMAEGDDCDEDCREHGACPGPRVVNGEFVHFDFDLDYALVLLEENVTDEFGYLQLRTTPGVIGERIYIPQHPHFWGKQVAAFDDYERDGTGDPGDFCIIDDIVPGPVEPHQIPAYHCDTSGGASGSPVIAHDDHLVIGLHNLNAEDDCFNGYNRADPAQDIATRLAENGVLPNGAIAAPGCPTCPEFDVIPRLMIPMATEQHHESFTSAECTRKTYKFYLGEGQDFRFTLCGETQASAWSSFPARLRILERGAVFGCSEVDPANVQEIPCASGQPELVFTPPESAVYFVEVSGTTPAAHGEYSLGYQRLAFDAVGRGCDVVDVKHRDGHTLALRGDGTVWSYGRNRTGELGIGAFHEVIWHHCNDELDEPEGYEYQETPVQVGVDLTGRDASAEPLTDVVAIAASWWGSPGSHSLALKSDGTVWQWGIRMPSVGLLTCFDWEFEHVLKLPRQIVPLDGVVAITAGRNWSLALKADGTVWGWGEGPVFGDEASEWYPTHIRGPGGEGVLEDIVSIAAGEDHALALAADGTVYAWGASFSGQVGDGVFEPHYEPFPKVVSICDECPPVSAIGAGWRHSLAIVGTGPASTLWTWGDNFAGQLGNGPVTTLPTGEECEYCFDAVPRMVGSCDGCVPLKGIVDASGGRSHTVILNSLGRVESWGLSSLGEHGDGRGALTRGEGDGLWLRYLPYADDRVEVAGLRDVRTIEAGFRHTVAARRDGTAWGWGRTGLGALGNGHHSYSGERGHPAFDEPEWGEWGPPLGASGYEGVGVLATIDGNAAPVRALVPCDGTGLPCEASCTIDAPSMTACRLDIPLVGEGSCCLVLPDSPSTTYQWTSSDPGVTFEDASAAVTTVTTPGSGDFLVCLETQCPFDPVTQCCTLITVTEEETPPIITCPADVTLDCHDYEPVGGALALTGQPAVDDECPIDAEAVTFTDEEMQDLACSSGWGVVHRTWMVTDAAGTTATCVQVITLEDDVPPDFDCGGPGQPACPEDLTLQCGEPVPAAATLTATDNCDASVIVDFAEVFLNSCTGGVARLWTTQDRCGNASALLQVIRFEDDGPPTITCPATTVVECDGDYSPSVTGEPVVTDACDPAPVVTHQDAVAVSLDCTPVWGWVQRTWIATDACGNSASCVQTIELEDTTPPVIVDCQFEINAGCGGSDAPEDIGCPVVSDCSGVSATWGDRPFSHPESCGGVGTLRTWQFRDGCGNVSERCVQRIVYVGDPEPVPCWLP